MPKRKRDSRNMGLPREYVEKYGKEVTLKVFTDASWDKFYQSGQGRRRLLKLLEKEDLKNEVIDIREATGPAIGPRTQASIEDKIAQTAADRANVPRKRRRLPGANNLNFLEEPVDLDEQFQQAPAPLQPLQPVQQPPAVRPLVRPARNPFGGAFGGRR